jgi:glycerol-3-phosphate cytidylyltransferase-like family protein
MHLSDCTVEPEKSREYQAQDPDASVKMLKPDILVIQDAWQDWTRKDLNPDFVKQYAVAYVKRIRDLDRKVHIKVHADIGSQKHMQRSYSWMREFSAHAREGGFDAPIYYEFSLGDYSR